MIVQIYYYDEDLVIDCIALASSDPTDTDSIRIEGIIKKLPKDTYLKNRPMTKSLNSTDFFILPKEYIVKLEDEEFYRGNFPEYFL